MIQLLMTWGLAYSGLVARLGDKPETDGLGAGDVASQEQPEQSASGRPVAMKGSGTRDTSMVYTQMFLALVSDKLIFGTTPSVTS